MKQLTVAYVGNFEPRHSTETHIARTLEEDLGHRVLRLQENHVHVNDILADSLNAGADLLLYTRTWGFEGDGRWLLGEFERHGIPTASYHLDLYWGISRQAGMLNDPFWRTKYVFTPDGASDEKFRGIGVNHFYMKPGVFRAECVRGTPRPQFETDVAFVGSLDTYHPEWLPYRQQLKRWLQGNYGDRFHNWPEDQPAVRNEDLNDLYATAKIVIGDSLCVGFDRPYYWSDRVYETLGRGGFLIHPYIEGMGEEFTDGENIVFFRFNDWDGLKEKIDFYLAHPEARKAISDRAMTFVRENCTYTNRLTQALNTIAQGEGWEMTRRYRKKPVEIEAVQLRWDTWNEMCEHAGVGRLSDGKPEGTFLNAEGEPVEGFPGTEGRNGRIGLLIPTLEGLMLGSENDWIIRGIQNELYPCKPDIFEATYEPVV